MPTYFKQAVKKLKRKTKKFQLKEFGPKALDYIDNCNAPINIQYGAIRSSKTTNSIVSWLDFLAYHDYDEFMQSGKTRTSLYRNVLRPQMAIMEAFNIDYDYHAHDGYLQIEDNTVWLVGFAHEGIAEIIRGMTIAGWNSDETNTATKKLVEEALDRLSIDDSRAFWTLNPDNPMHYINQEYIINKEKRAAGDVKVWHYEMEDNPNLSKEYIARQKRRYPKGTAQYKRKIKGLFVVDEGVIYSKFIEAHHTFTDPEYDKYDYYMLTTDYGSSNVTVVGLMGIKRTEEGNHYHLLDEMYYDVNDPKNNNVYIDDPDVYKKAIPLLNFNGEQLPLDTWWVPHDASSLRTYLRKQKYQGKKIKAKTYKPNVLNDIDEIRTLINEGRFKIATKCVNSIEQIQSYSWDPKATAKGKDEPLKINDHCPDMWRAAILGNRGTVLRKRKRKR